MLERNEPFLQNGNKREQVRQGLMRMTNSHGQLARQAAISVLRYFNEPDVVALLTTISQNDIYTIDGRFPIRTQALDALRFIQERHTLSQ